MQLSLILVLFASIQSVHADCWNFEGQCIPSLTTSSRQDLLLQNKTWLYQAYADKRTIYFSDSSCKTVSREVLTHNSYDATFCYSTVESVWVRYTDTSNSYIKTIVENCGSKLTKQFVNIADLSCTVNDVDPFAAERRMVGVKQQQCIRFYDDIPSIKHMTMTEKCDANNDVGDSFLNTVVTIFAIGVVVIVIIVIVTVFFVVRGVNSKRMKKVTVNQTSSV